MTCTSCEKHLKHIAHLKSQMDRQSFQLELTQDLYEKERENCKFFMEDREKIRKELIEMKERMT